MNIWLLTNSPAPYQEELFAAIAGRSNVTLHVRYMRGSDCHVLRRGVGEKSTACIVKGVGPLSWPDELRLHPRVLWECLSGDYDCYVLSGLWTSVTLIVCTVLLYLRGRRRVLWLERPHSEKLQFAAVSRRGWSAPLSRIFGRVRGALLSRSDAVLCIGTSGRQAYSSLGVSEQKLFVLPYCCETARFQWVARDRAHALRDRYCLHGKTVFLFSGQMIPRKGVDTVIRIFKSIAEQRSDVALLLLGDGPQKAEYEAMVAEELRPNVHFAGFVAQPELPAYFAVADIFVFPSRHDGWGVVINEACAAGLPVVVSRQTGAAQDLVEDGRSGFVLDAEDIEGFVDHLILLIDNPALRIRYGRRSRELVEPYSATNGAALFTKYLHQVLERAENASGTAGSSRNVA